jgi:hypothetical protein
MQCRCAAENERHCEGYRCYDQYTRERDIGHHKCILCGVCCVDVGSDMTVHLDEHLMLVPGRLTVATTQSPGLETLHVGTALQHAPEGLVASYQEVIALRGVTVLGVVDLLVCVVHAHAQYLDQNASSFRNVVHPASGRSARAE